MMKLLAAFFFVLSLSFCQAQITIKPYLKEFKCDVDGVQDLDPVEATSDSGPVNTKIDEVIASGGCAGTLIRTYTFTDKFGNVAKAEQYIKLSDNLEPQLIGVPINVSVTEDQLPMASHVDSWDNIGQAPPVEFKESREGNVITRIWTCTDPCGNVASGKQIITIIKK
jgi:hypothetical protein